MNSSNTKYFFEESRIESFKNWPFKDTESCSIKKMAEAGFYWCGTEKDPDTVSCFVCGKVLDGWEPTDNPWFEHHKHAPQCKFAKLGKPEKGLTMAELYSIMEVVIRNVLIKHHDNEMKKLEEEMDIFKQFICSTLRK